jgi:hypothetical protein
MPLDGIDDGADAFRQALDQTRHDQRDQRQKENGQQRDANPFQDGAEVKEEGRIHDGLPGYLFASRAA